MINVVDVDYGNYFVAVGAALSDDARATDMREMETCIARAEQEAAAETRTADFTLFKDAADYEAFKQRHDRDRVKRGNLADYRGADLHWDRCGLDDDEACCHWK